MFQGVLDDMVDLVREAAQKCPKSGKNSIISKMSEIQKSLKGVVASYQAAFSEEYTPLERVKPVLTWSRGGPGHNKVVSDDQKPKRCHKV